MRLIRTMISMLVLGVLVMTGLALATDFEHSLELASSIPTGTLLAALGLALANYLLRLFKWWYYLGLLEHEVPRQRSGAVFFTGLAMSMTPGKLGELLKAWLLKELDGVPVSATAPVVLAERLTDLLALVLLVTGGVWSLGYGWDVVLAASGLCLAVVLAVTLPSVTRFCVSVAGCVPVARRFAADLGRALANTSSLVRPVPLVLASLISVAAWFAECLAFYLILAAVGVDVTVFQATFIYGLATIAGAVTFLPGGLVATEASMVLLLTTVLSLCGDGPAAAATLVVRLCTLWFAVFLGAAVLMLHPRIRATVLRFDGATRRTEEP